jgi:ADP-ribosylglycohydrolase
MDECMKMPGGGVFKIGPGQITDDSELAMCMLHGLANSGNKYD